MTRPKRRRHGTVTIQHVAREAGVSAMTVSRVINGESNVRDTTRSAVLAAIEKLNYSPNTAARSLAAGEALHIGLLYANPSAAYLSQFLVGTLEGARRAGCHVVLEPCESERADEQAEATRRFATSGVDGVILPPPLSESLPVHAELAAIGTPVVTVAMGGTHADGLDVRIDDRAAAEEMTRHLLDLGHRRVGFIVGHPNNRSSGERLQGFRDALIGAGLDPDQMPVEQGYFTYRSGLVAAQRLLAREPRPTAIFASNDDMAAAAISVAHRAGLDVPGDVSIVGFDDTAPATTVWPELTTVRQPIAAMAEQAVDMLLAELRARRSGRPAGQGDRVLKHSLVVRESSAAPPANQAGKKAARD
ncbi:LacI family DNA-binding transcriptional regulator [Sphingosinicella ginsenosidimutans]|uniref:LacI family transcriptional regulator n=1 Tax=Allosphingosinicella ginsenosidimutans TaxID=1176539 RepID=A0A5C6TUU9_9SPHN|nr:LacI family DNA-binding transcriptional regulator [Sphingosinicella ginsenosidimutans]TXC63999.1 LacI family transcriptional regulator [Sphingosinicella ginsenosidimutans]